MKLVIDGQTVEVPGGGGSDFPSGGIIIWSGAADNIPSGWALCDGQNGTPDLQDKFVLGAGTNHAVGSEGGEENHTLTLAEMPQHRHAAVRYVGSGTDQFGSSASGGKWMKYGTAYESVISQTEYSGSSQAHNNMPPYYALCYIMKL